MRSATGTNSLPPFVVTRATKSVIDFFVAPSFQDGSGSPPGVCAEAPPGRKSPAAAMAATSERRVIVVFILGIVASPLLHALIG